MKQTIEQEEVDSMDVIHLQKAYDTFGTIENLKYQQTKTPLYTLATLEEMMIRTIAAARCTAGTIDRAFYNKTQNIIAAPAHDLKLDIDMIAEEKILAILKNFYPDHTFYSEESGLSIGTEPYVWVIDPLDGSVNHYFGIGECAISIACFQLPDPISGNLTDADIVQYGLPLLGMILLPRSQDIYTAVHGEGAFFNGVQMEISRKPLSDSVLAMNFSGRGNNINLMPGLLERLISRALKIRSYGATAVDCAWVASGRLGALIQRGTNLWDFAAGKIIIEEAGGVFSCLKNPERGWDIITGHPLLFKEIIEYAGDILWI